MLSGPSFRPALVFSINSLILSSFPLTFFHLAEASLSAFSRLYTLVCAVVQNYLQIFIFLVFIFRPFFLLSQLKNVNKLWNNNRTVHVNEPNQTKKKPSHVTFKMTTRHIVRFSLQTRQWHHSRMALRSDATVKIKIFCQ